MFDESDITPVIAPIGVSKNGETLNINADTAAGAIGAALAAKRLLMLTDVEGVLDPDGNRESLTVTSAQMHQERHHHERHDPESRNLHHGH